jgi:hypothetical protein
MDFDDDAAFAGNRLEEQVTPFLRMAQGLSPEVNPGKGEHIPGLTIGSIFNTVTKEFYPGKDGLDAIACWKDYHYGKWVPRDLGGGYRGSLSPNHQLVLDTMNRMAEIYGDIKSARYHMPRYRDGAWTADPPYNEETNEPIELVETGQIYVIYGPPPLTLANARRAIISCTSTALKSYALWNSTHNNMQWQQSNGSRKAAMIYSYLWRITTFQDHNKKGEFFNWKFVLSPPGASYRDALVDRRELIYAEAKKFHDQAENKEVIVAEDQQAQPDGDMPF